MRTTPICFLLFACLAGSVAAEDSPLVADRAKLQTLADGFTFTEGPARAANGDLYFTDIRQNKIHRWDVRKETLSTFVTQSDGANGMQFAEDGRLLACQGGQRRVVAIDKEGKVAAVLADTYDGQPFNKPNDLWIAPDGAVYFTDPAYSMTKEEIKQDGKHVYRISPDGKTVTKVANDYNTPNGIVGTPDGKQLYITDRRLGRTWRYNVQADGTLDDKELFCKVGADGMTLDERGNLYTTPRANEIRIFNPDGKQIATIPLPKPASNVCFAGEDGKTLFITARDSLFAIKMNVTGQ